jgi:SAM-dependent methyltransferase
MQMGDYTKMSAYYDTIMTSGYYDYRAIVDGLLNHHPFENVLEIGCGTGLILEEIARREPKAHIRGIDLTQSMLEIAQKRLEQFPNIKLSQQNITELSLEQQYRLAFSYGGVWYFVIDGDKEPFLVSHIYDEQANHLGLASLSKFVQPGGKLLLGIQGPHHDYEKPISNGMIYSQKIEPLELGFTKHYYLDDKDDRVMAQTIHYRTYNFSDAKQLLSSYGFEYEDRTEKHQHFLEFKRV